MTALNTYATRAEFLQWITPSDTTAATVDDVVIDAILEGVSRWIDDQTMRFFYPLVETRKYDLPGGRSLILDGDLLEVLTLTNGDDTTIASTNYNLFPANVYPKRELRLTQGTTVIFVNDGSNSEQVIDVRAIYGFHEQYGTRGWLDVTTLAEDVDISEKPIDVASATNLPTGAIWRVDDEIFISDSVATNTVTVAQRGENGSTAATHDNGATVQLWQPQPSVNLTCKQIAQNVYRRFGNTQGDENIVTASGVVITPRDVPSIAKTTISHLRRRL